MDAPRRLSSSVRPETQSLPREWLRRSSLALTAPSSGGRRCGFGAVARTRGALRAPDELAARLVGELRTLQRPPNEVFRDVYSISDPFVRPAALAGSCPVTRRNGTVSFVSSDPEVTAITEAAASL